MIDANCCSVVIIGIIVVINMGNINMLLNFNSAVDCNVRHEDIAAVVVVAILDIIFLRIYNAMQIIAVM